MPPRFARGRRTAASTRAGNVGSQSRKKSFRWSLFCGSVPSASRPCGLSASRLTQERRGIHATSLLSIARLLSRGRSYCLNTMGFRYNLFYYHVTLSGFSNFGLDLLLQCYVPL
ncbi:MAG TPA: hypothetical protein PLL08_05315 [Bacteroidales bacterium]|nr:hypothetical protein [Bacteroidales bacterium]